MKTAVSVYGMIMFKVSPMLPYVIIATNMVLTGKTERNTVVKLKEKEYCTLAEAVAEMEKTLSEAVHSTINQINIIKAQTAIGKTHCYVNLIKNSGKRFIIAVPTNILKEEVYNRLKYAGVVGVVKTASISTLEQSENEIGQRVKEFNSLGAYNDLVEYLKKEAKEDILKLKRPPKVQVIYPQMKFYTKRW